MKDATVLTQKFADAKLGLISLTAQDAIKTKDEHLFLESAYEEMTKEAPANMVEMFGDQITSKLQQNVKDIFGKELTNELIEYFEK